jgi:hypothetical protein
MNAKTISSRIKSARQYTGLSRKAFAEKGGLKLITLKSWEIPSIKRLTYSEKTLENFIQAAKKNEIIVSKEWLLNGTPPGPRLAHSRFNFDTPSWNDEEAIVRDINSFVANNNGAIVQQILNDNMMPQFQCGDYVGGKPSPTSPEKFNNKTCIIQTTKETFIKVVTIADDDSVVLLNTTSGNSEPIYLLTEEIRTIAEVIWYRKRSQALISY